MTATDPLPTLAKGGATVLRFSMLLFAIVGLSLFLTGCVYLSVDQFMPYHAEALQADWSDLDSNSQGLILGLLRGLGSGAAMAGFAVLYMVGTSLVKNPRPYLVLLPSIAIGYSALLCFATYTVYVKTPGNPPLLLGIALIAVSSAASIGLVLSQRDRDAV
jgi:hypothetical protein